MAKRGPFYHSPVVKPLSREKVQELSTELSFRCGDEELDVFTEEMNDVLKSYERLDKMCESRQEVRYPRTPGYRPVPEENLLNAWYYRCDIKGASAGKLVGKRIGIKDNIAIAGVPMMNGSKILEGYVPEFDATVVTRILDAGGHILGKTACDDMCFSSGGFSSSYGPILQPGGHIPSGSSSGNAVLIASGEIDMAVGGDQGGSIRFPAAHCGIVGLKPTFGLVPFTGSISMVPCLDHLGPMAKTVKDCALLLEVLAGFDDGHDSRQTQSTCVTMDYSKKLTARLDGVKIGLVREGFDWAEPEVADCVRSSIEKLKQVGAEVEEITIPIHKDGIHIYTPLATEGAYQSIIRDNGLSTGFKETKFLSLLDKMAQAQKVRPWDLPETLKMTAILGKYLMTSYNGRFYAKALSLTRVLTLEYNKAFSTFDVLVMPTMLRKPKPFVKRTATLKERFSVGLGNGSNTAPFNATGHPSLSINAGYIQGLSIGMMITGKHFDDVTVLRVGYAFEQLYT